jgi:dienelactone hydrolase
MQSTLRPLAAAITAALALAAPAGAATPPGQPASGPGSSSYPYPSAPFVNGVAGTTTTGGWTTFEPNPRPASAPIVVLIHGNCVVAYTGPCATNPTNVGMNAGLATHLAKKGNVVILPRYQVASNYPAPATQVQKALDGISAALTYLDGTGHTHGDRTRFGVVGHSRGGWVGANAVALLQAQGLPHPDYLVAFEPGESTESGIPQGNWSTVPSDMDLLTTVGDDDTISGEGTSRYGAGIVFNGMTTVPTAQKDYVRVRSDSHGSPALDANHDYILDGTVNAMDWYAGYKLVDAMRDCTGYGTNCAYALGNTSQQRGMGLWSDGVPVKELCIDDVPGESWSIACAGTLP